MSLESYVLDRFRPFLKRWRSGNRYRPNPNGDELFFEFWEPCIKPRFPNSWQRVHEMMLRWRLATD